MTKPTIYLLCGLGGVWFVELVFGLSNVSSIDVTFGAVMYWGTCKWMDVFNKDC